MKRLLLAMLILFAALPLCAAQRVAIATSGWAEVVIVDKASKEIVATYALDKGSECNSVYVDPKGNVAYSYKQGARMVNSSGRVLWDYKVEYPAEVQCIKALKRGFVLGICGDPARIVELDAKGRETHTIPFAVGSKGIHGQFRHITPLLDGTYLVPLMSKGEVVHIDREGQRVGQPIELKGNLFAVDVASNGNYIVSAGDSHCAYEVTPQGSTVRTIEAPKGGEFAFVGAIQTKPNGSMLVGNWLGHYKGDRSTLLHVIEIDDDGQMVWSYRNPSHNFGASAIYEYKTKK